MKIAVIGSGAMGLFLGGMLAKAGNEVTMIDVVPKVIDILNEKGIHLEAYGEDSFVPVKASFAKDMTEQVDLAVLFTKTIFSKAALDECHTYVGPNTCVMTMQNGLGNIELIRNYVSEDKIIAAVTTYAGDLKGPGHTAVTGKGYLKMMSANNQMSEALTAFDKMFNDAGLGSKIVPDVMVAIWEKVAFNAAINATTAICHVPCGGMMATEEGRQLVYRVADETCAVAKAHGVAASAEAVRGNLDVAMTKMADHFTSMAQDIRGKRRTEAAFINGGILDKAREVRIAAPLNETLYGLLRTIESTYDIQE